jgi:hypothetical protein
VIKEFMIPDGKTRRLVAAPVCGFVVFVAIVYALALFLPLVNMVSSLS